MKKHIALMILGLLVSISGFSLEKLLPSPTKDSNQRLDFNVLLANNDAEIKELTQKLEEQMNRGEVQEIFSTTRTHLIVSEIEETIDIDISVPIGESQNVADFENFKGTSTHLVQLEMEDAILPHASDSSRRREPREMSLEK